MEKNNIGGNMKDISLFIQNHPTLAIAFVVVLLLLFIVETARLKLNAQRISPLEATHLINHQHAVVVDIRSLEAFRSGHLLGALSLPFPELEKQYKKLEKHIEKPIIITCAAGLESPRAADFLLKNGYKVQILAGGVRAWKEAEMPLVKD